MKTKIMKNHLRCKFMKKNHEFNTAVSSWKKIMELPTYTLSWENYLIITLWHFFHEITLFDVPWIKNEKNTLRILWK